VEADHVPPDRTKGVRWRSGLFDRVLAGGVAALDDYGWKMFHRQKEAEDDFMRRRSYEILELPTGQGLVVKR
jgi:O-methyltransferase